MNIKVDGIFLLVFFILTAVAIAVFIVWARSIEKRLKRFFLGKKAKDLEDTIAILEDNITKLTNSKEQIEKDIKIINTKLKRSIRGLETIRFNPFTDQGSNQSFAIGLMNEEGNGVVLSSLYARERMSIFAKPIVNNKSEYELTKEEQEVLNKAQVA